MEIYTYSSSESGERSSPLVADSRGDYTYSSSESGERSSPLVADSLYFGILWMLKT